MGDVVAKKEDLIRLNEEEYNLGRSDEVSHSVPCYAPYVSLEVRESGEVSPCPYFARPVGYVGKQTLESIWDGSILQAMRLGFQEFQVKAKDCGTCVNHWKVGNPTESPAIRMFDPFAFSLRGSPYVPRILRLDLQAPLTSLDFKTVLRWLPRLTHLDVVMPWPLSVPSYFGPLLDHVSMLPDQRRPQMTLRIRDSIPNADHVPEGINVLHLSLGMTGEMLAPPDHSALMELTRSLRPRGIKLILAVSVHQENWFSLRSWLRLAQQCDFSLETLLAPPGDNRSLAGLSGDGLSCMHDMFEHWFSTFPVEATDGQNLSNRQELLAQIRQWQQDAAERLTLPSRWALPDLQCSLVQDEMALEPFLRCLLRIYAEPVVEQWLMSLVERQSFAAEARNRRSFRLGALWLACVFDRMEILPQLQSIFGTPHEATHVITKDRKALAGTPWEDWVESWFDKLNLSSLQIRAQRFAVGPPQDPILKESSTITVILVSHNHQGFVGDALRSVLAQTRTDFRLLMIDDASKDRTVAEAKKIKDSRIRIMQNLENQRHGPSLARALETVDTEFVALMDADDLYHPHRLARCLSLLQQAPHVEVVATGLAVIDDKGLACSTVDSSPVFDGFKNHRWLQWYEQEARLTRPPENLLEGLLKQNFLITCSNFVGRTDFLRRSREQWQRLEYCIDWQVYLSAALEQTLSYVPDALLGYRLHQSNQKWTHCFAETAHWGYYIESHQVVARTLEQLFNRCKEPDSNVMSSLSAAITALNAHTTLDAPGVQIGSMLDRLDLVPRDLDGEEVCQSIQSLMRLRDRRRQAMTWFSDYGEGLGSQPWKQEEVSFLKALRNRHEVLEHEHGRLQGEVRGVRMERANMKKLWHMAEQERDQALTALKELHQELGQLRKDNSCLHSQINTLLYSLERRVGEFLTNRLHCRPLLQGIEWVKVNIQRQFTFWELTVERWLSTWRHDGSRVLATVCSTFPIYSQTFAHQELSQLAHGGFQPRVVYSFLESKSNLHQQFDVLWKSKSRLSLHPESNEQDFVRYQARFPAKVERLIHMIADASGLSREQLTRHSNFLQAFSFTRMVEVYRPHYLHSYFFYDRSLMALVAGYLLDIPRGISCYADHVLDDYDLKLVPLHLELCDIVIATSERIKAELLAIAPNADSTRILVKPNAIDTTWFPMVERREPHKGEPFRLVCVNRIEPKKGLLFLVEAIHHVRQQGLDVELHVIGTADQGMPSSQQYQQRLHDCIVEYDLGRVVHLEGQQNQEGVLRFLEMAHVFIAPFVETDYGDKDGIPTALLEAMATGLPVVVTDAGSMREVIRHGREGEMVPQRDAEALASGIVRLLADPQRRRQLGKAAMETVQERFDVRVCEDRFHDRVRSAIESRQGSHSSSEFSGLECLMR